MLSKNCSSCYRSDSFPKETKNLRKSCLLSKPSIIEAFSPSIGPNGFPRHQGRTKHLEVGNFDVKHPILLDSRQPAQKRHCHKSVEYLRALIQQKYGIVGGVENDPNQMHTMSQTQSGNADSENGKSAKRTPGFCIVIFYKYCFGRF